MTEVSFGEWLKRQRMGRGLTQEQLARQIGCAAITLRKIEAEERRPSAEIVDQVINIFEIPQSEKDNFLKFARGDWTKAPGENSTTKPWQVTKSTRTNLPISLTSFIGRDKELSEIIELLAQHRLVTLMGPGGMGKTRLSIEVARTLFSEFPDGVFFVALAPLTDPNLIARAVVHALGFVEDASRPAEQQLREGISSRQMLLVLDNCEHLIEGVAALVTELLSSCPRIKIIATSRESFRIPGEWIYTVPGFDIPEESAAINEKLPALILFAERARAVRSDFALTADNLSIVSSICMHLDGLPLAIELIAARMRLMPPQALLERLSGQFILNADGMRSTSERQQTLNNAIRWSYDLLTENEQKLFSYLSVFSGGFTLDAVEAMFSQTFIGQPISNLIASLLDKSLLQREARSDARYKMLVMIQEFAHDRLLEMGEETEIRHRHLKYFCALAEQARPQLFRAQQLIWLDRLDIEYENIHLALKWAQTSDAAIEGLLLATNLELFWFWRSHLQELSLALENLLAQPMPADQIQTFAKGHHVKGRLHLRAGNRLLAETHFKESERLWLLLGADGKADLAQTRQFIYSIDGTFAKDPTLMRQGIEKNLKLSEEAGNQVKTATWSHGFGIELARSGDLAGARQAFEKSLRLHRESGDTIFASLSNQSLALLALDEGNYMEAREQLEENLHSYRRAHLNSWIDGPLWLLGVIAMREGDYVRAKELYTECLLFDIQIGLPVKQLAECLIGFAGIATAEQRLERAAPLLGAAESVIEARPSPGIENIDQIELKRLAVLLHEELGGTKFEQLMSEGYAMTMEQAIKYALEELED